MTSRVALPLFAICLAARGLSGLSGEVPATGRPAAATQNSVPPVAIAVDERSRSGLLAFYDFSSADGDLVHDQSEVGEALNLRIADMKAVRRSAGSLEFLDATIARSEKPATKIIEAVKQTESITIEAWIRPAQTDQTGPARIVTFSQNTGERNITLGQGGDTYDVRFRTTNTDSNGNPSTASPPKTLNTELTHVAYTRQRSGRAALYVNGILVSEKDVAGALTNWNAQYHLAFGNELTNDRPWLGSFHLVAIYSRPLPKREIEMHVRAGAGAAGSLAKHTTPNPDRPPSGSHRVSTGLQALYDFSSSDGDIVTDQSGAGEPLHLKIADLGAVGRSDGALEIRKPTTIRSEQPATKLTEAIRRSNSLTVEAWIRPARTDQTGPARIVTISRDANERNVTLGQDGDKFDVRLRTSKTTTNGIPSLPSASQNVTTKLTHVVYTRDPSGRARIYIDGQPSADAAVPGDCTNWNGDFHLALANEQNGSRQWLGAYHLVAIFSRALSPAEVAQNFAAGPAATMSPELLAEREYRAKARHFELKIAGLFARHCLECHDSSTKEGGLDLSVRTAALAGGETGLAIVPGFSSKSEMWKHVASDEMPKERSPLSADEKQLLKQWLDDGAIWSLESIDPVLYAVADTAGQLWVQRLTVAEYIETVRAAVSVDIEKEAREILPADLRADGFSNTAYNLNVDFQHVDAYAKLAEIIVSRMDVEAFARQFSNKRKFTDDDMGELIGRMGKWLLRGPLEDREIIAYRGITTTVAAAGGDYEEAVGLLLEAMLQSPRFIYRVENQRGDGTSWPVGDFELASRLSYIVWGGPPDKELFQAAESGNLGRDGVRAQVERMLDDPRAIARSSQFLSEWLNLNRLNNLQPNRDRYPHWNPRLAADMQEETLAFFVDVAWTQNRPLWDLLNAQVTFATPELALHYGLTDAVSSSADGASDARELSRYDLTTTPGRGGLLTQGSVLTVGGDEASMVTRGLFVLHDLLRGAVKDPPPCVDTTPIPTKPGLTQRGIALERIANSACGGCHSKFEPLAFGLEKFDGLGSYHDRDEYGNELREDGEILFPGTALPVQFGSSAELMNLLAESRRVRECLSWKVTQFALGRPLTAADAPALGRIHEAAENAGGTYRNLITAIALSDLVLMTRTEESN